MSAPTARRTEQAAAAVRANEARGLAALEVIGRLSLRAEGLASSAIDGLRATPVDVAMAAASKDRSSTSTAACVADNLAVLDESLNTRGRLTTRHILRWHKRLMREAPTVEELSIPMEDLVAFVARDDLDPITIAAVAHAQFDAIRPFADGNGRIGRVLVGWVLVHRLEVSFPPPISLAFARDIGGYQSGLALYRDGSIDAWVRWFADKVIAAAARTARVLQAVDELQAQWHSSTAHMRADAAARRLLPLLPAHPVLTTEIVSELLDISNESSRSALQALAALGILVEIDRVASGVGRPRRWWVAQDLLRLVG